MLRTHAPSHAPRPSSAALFSGSSVVKGNKQGLRQKPHRQSRAVAVRGEKEILNKLTSMETSFNTKLDGINVSFNTKLDGINTAVSNLSTQVAPLVEQQARSMVEKMLGPDYAKYYVARSIEDVLMLLPRHLIYDRDGPSTAGYSMHQKCLSVARHLVKLKIPLKVIQKMEDVAQRKGVTIAQPWVTGSQVNVRAINVCLETVKEKCGVPFQTQLISLRVAMMCKGPASQAKALLPCSGPGLLCLMAAANPSQLDTSQPEELPQTVLEFDVCGKTEAVESGGIKFGTVDVGGVKSGGRTPGTALVQLAVRIHTLDYALSFLMGVPQGSLNVRRIGRAFFMGSSTRLSTHDQQAEVDSAMGMGFSLYMHFM